MTLSLELAAAAVDSESLLEMISLRPAGLGLGGRRRGRSPGRSHAGPGPGMIAQPLRARARAGLIWNLGSCDITVLVQVMIMIS